MFVCGRNNGNISVLYKVEFVCFDSSTLIKNCNRKYMSYWPKIDLASGLIFSHSIWECCIFSLFISSKACFKSCSKASTSTWIKKGNMTYTIYVKYWMLAAAVFFVCLYVCLFVLFSLSHLPLASFSGNQFVSGSPQQAWAPCDYCSWIPGKTKDSTWREVSFNK